MAYLLDTGILLRLVNVDDHQHDTVRKAVDLLTASHEDLFITIQNIAEFWNVATRPIAENGLGFQTASVATMLNEIIEPTCALLVESVNLYAEFKRIVQQYRVNGKQVHDARLVAMMLVWNVDKVLTLNDRDFRRYEPEGISVITPESLLASGT